jgi:prepilin-type N-terminal cleavage/methylation domain-containing protein
MLGILIRLRTFRPGVVSLTSDRPARGFTLIEVLVALAIAVVLCGAISSGLVLALREETRSADAGEMALAVRTAAARRLFHPDPSPEPIGGFEIERTPVETGDDDEKQAWDQWTLFAPDRPSHRLVLLFPVDRAAD